MPSIHITGGKTKKGLPEPIPSLTLTSGNVYSIVGKTGSGKTQLIDDIETRAEGDGVTGRVVRWHTASTTPMSQTHETARASEAVAHLSQNMRFVMDMSVLEFLERRMAVCSRSQAPSPGAVLSCANALCGEPIAYAQRLTRLSGGQTRALMIADIALISSAHTLLIDEIENAGIDKVGAIDTLIRSDKIVLLITHDPLLALTGNWRLVMADGGISKVMRRTPDEEALLLTLHHRHLEEEALRRQLRRGDALRLQTHAQHVRKVSIGGAYVPAVLE